MRSPLQWTVRPLLLLTALGLSVPTAASAQHFSDCLTQQDTGTSASVVIDGSAEITLPNGARLEAGDEVALVTDDGRCAGRKEWDSSASNVSLVAAGPLSSSTVEGNGGFSLGEPLKYHVWDASAGREFDLGTEVEYEPCDGGFLCESDGLYENDAIFTVTSIGPSSSLPIELGTFSAQQIDRDVLLRWRTLSETNNAGFAVLHKRPSGADWIKRGFVAGTGTTPEQQEYRFRLSSLVPGRHAFRLRQVDRDGTTSLTAPISVTVTAQTSFALSPVRPNPVHRKGRLILRTDTKQHVRVTLYNSLGQNVRRLRSETVSPNRRHVIPIDAESLPSGTYVVRAVGRTKRASRRVVIVR